MPTRCVLAVLLAATSALGLGARAAGQSKAPTDRHGDPLPAGAIGRLGTVQLRCGDASLTFLPDGKTLAVVGNGPAPHITLLDRETGKELTHYRLGDDDGGNLTVSPDRKLLVSCGSSRLNVYDLATGKRLRSIALGTVDRPTSAPFGFSGDGSYLHTVREDRSGADVWDIRTGLKRHRLRPAKGIEIVNAVALSPDGRRMIAQGEGSRERVVWDLEAGKIGGAFPSIRPPLFAPDSTTFATADAHDKPAVVLRDAATGTPLFTGRDEDADVIAYSPDSRMLAIALRTGTIRVRDIAKRRELLTLDESSGRAQSLLLARDGTTLVAVGCDGSAQCWQLPAGKKLHQMRLPKGETAESWKLSDDGKMLACVNGGAIRRWDMATGRELPLPSGPTHGIRHLVMTPDGNTVAAVYGNTTWNSRIITWNISTQTPRANWRCDGNFLYEPGFTPDGKSLVTMMGAPPFAVHRWDVATGKECGKNVLDRLRAEDSGGIAPDGRAVSWNFKSGRLVLLDLISNKRQTVRLARDTEPSLAPFPLSYAFTADGRRLACFAVNEKPQGYMTQWDLGHGRELPRVAMPASFLLGMPTSYSADGRILSGIVTCFTTNGPDAECICWEAATGKPCLTVQSPDFVLGACAALSPDGRRLVIGGPTGTVAVWDMPSGKQLRLLDGHRGRVSALRFASDGKTLLTGGEDTTVLIWDMTRIPPPRVPLGTLDARWAELAHADAAIAQRAIWALADAPALAVPFLAARLKPVAVPDAAQVQQWIADLGDAEYTTRETAMHELEQLGCLIEEPLAKAVKAASALEARRRVERLLDSVRGVPAPAQLRRVRAVHALELAGSPDARTLLQSLAAGAPGARQTWEAQAALERLKKRAAR